MKQNTLYREIAAEFLGTFILIVFGVASVAQAVLSHSTNVLMINLGWGLAVTMGIYVAAGVSGAHLNPAVTLALAVFKKCSWSKVLPYTLAQMAGAFVASGVVFLSYRDALTHFDHGIRQIEGPLATAGIWATYPQPFLSIFPGGVLDQIVGTALLVIVVFALGDQKNNAPKPQVAPLLVGAAVLLIGLTFGYNSGYAINPARDLAPRLFTALAGWGWGVFEASHAWWWVPVVAPCIGSLLGGFLYSIFIEKHHPEVVQPISE